MNRLRAWCPARWTTGGIAMALWVLVAIPAAIRAQSSVELPVWTEEDAQKYVDPGSTLLGRGLWPNAMIPEEGEAAVEAARQSLEQEGAEGGDMQIPASDPTTRPADLEVPEMKLMSRELEKSTPRPAEEPALPMPPRIVTVPEEFQPAYFSERPRAFLIDPQQLLTEQKVNDIERFLEYHQEESEFAIYMFIFGPNQELPDDVSLRELHKEWFGSEPAVLMVYFFGQPDRGLLEFGEEVAKMVRGRVIDKIRANCVDEGMVAENPFNQLERFAIELSIRLYWLEKEHWSTDPEPGGAVLAEGSAKPADVVEADGVAKVRIVVLASTLGLAIVALVLLLYWRFLRPSRRVYAFPDYDINPRLSAPHSGGGHAVMFFGKRETEAMVYGNEGGG